MSLGRASQRSIAARQSSIELAEKSPEAVTPCGSRRQPSTRMQSATSAAISCMYAVVRVEASRRRGSVAIGSGSGRSRQAMPESTSEEGIGSRLPWLPSDIQAELGRRRPRDSIASSIIRTTRASETAEMTSLTWTGASSARWSVTTVERSRPAASCSSVLVPGPGDRPAQDEGGARLRGDQVDGDDDSEDLARPREDRDMADVVVEHGQHHVRAGLVSAPTPITGALIAALTGSIGGEAARDDAGAQVAVGDDPELAVHRARPGPS